jgi:hypothetical protein
MSLIATLRVKPGWVGRGEGRQVDFPHAGGSNLAERRTDFEAARERARKEDPAFYAKLAAAKRPS